MSTRSRDYEYYRSMNYPPPREQPTPVSKKPELTAFGHVGHALLFAVCWFTTLGGLLGAILGDIQAWEHLNWVFALTITVGIVSLAFGIGMHLIDRMTD